MCFIVHLYASKILLVFSEHFNEQKVKKNSIYVIKKQMYLSLLSSFNKCIFIE